MVRSDGTGKYSKFVMYFDNIDICSIDKVDVWHEIENYYGGDYETFLSIGGKFNDIVHKNRQAELLELFDRRLLCNKVTYSPNKNILEKARRSLYWVDFSTNTTKEENEDTLLIQLFKHCLGVPSADFEPSSARGKKPKNLSSKSPETWMGTARGFINRCLGGRCSGDNTSDFKAKRSKRKMTSAKKPVKKPVKKALQKTPKKPVKKTPKKASKKSHARRV
jgi:hypothetical protein